MPLHTRFEATASAELARHPVLHANTVTATQAEPGDSHQRPRLDHAVHIRYGAEAARIGGVRRCVEGGDYISCGHGHKSSLLYAASIR